MLQAIVKKPFTKWLLAFVSRICGCYIRIFDSFLRRIATMFRLLMMLFIIKTNFFISSLNM